MSEPLFREAVRTAVALLSTEISAPMDGILLTVGICLVLFCLAQMAFWTAHHFSRQVAERKYWQLHGELLRAKIAALAIRPELAGTPVVASPGEIPGATDRTTGSLAPAWRGWRTLRVHTVLPETTDTTSIYLVAQDRLPLPEFLPGQFLTLRLQLPSQNVPVIRCYSLSDAPNSSYYRITVKDIHGRAQPQGGASHFINRQWAVGDLVEVKAPAGDFFWKSQSNEPVIFLAGGVGITPLMSMIETALRQGMKAELLLVYGVRSGDEHIFRERLRELAKQHANFQLLTCYSQPLETDVIGRDYHVSGRLSIELIRWVVPNPKFRFYLCGPGQFLTDLHQQLCDWGVSKQHIHFEAFGPATVPIDKLPSPVAPHTETSTSLAKIRFAKSQRICDWTGPETTLLDAGLEAGLALNYGCRIGQCGECQTRLLDGAVAYPHQAPSEIAAGYCLPCIAVPNPHKCSQGEVVLDA